MAPGGLAFCSPARAQADPFVLISSSPEFPSISDLVPKSTRRPPLRSGSRAAPIPDNAPKIFTSAASVWRSLDDDDGSITPDRKELENKPAPGAANTPAQIPVVALSPKATDRRMPSLSRPTTTIKTTGTKAARALKQTPIQVTDAITLDNHPTSPKQKLRKMSTSSKNTKDGQTTIPRGKVTKPTSRGKSQRREPEVVSKHFQTNGPPVETVEIEDSIDLEPALKRRTDWTPAKDTTTPHPPYDLATVGTASSPSFNGAKLAAESSNAVFQNLLDTYGCIQLEAPARSVKDASGAMDVLGKRKQLNLITTTETETPEASPVKSKAPKKKARTITELATAAYRVTENEDDSTNAQQPPLLRYLDVDDGRQSEGADKPLGGKRRVSKKATKAKATKKAEPRRQILLSPASAMRLVSNQDFVFGTSSQLATEQDPALLRDLHEAMRVSNHECHEDVFVEPLDTEQSDRPPKRRLWGAGARDVDGDLLNIEVIDLASSPAVPKDLTNPTVINALVTGSAPGTDTGEVQAKVQTEVATSTVEESELVGSYRNANSRSRFSKPEQVGRRKAPAPAPSAPVKSTANPTAPPAAIDTLSIDDEPPASNQEQNQLARSTQPAHATNPCQGQVEASRPTYELFTDAQLAKEIRGYGFKAVKRRTAMVALLDQCWASKNKAAQDSRASSAAALSTSSTSRITAAPAASVPPTTRPRGRPKKTESSKAPSTKSTPAPESPAKRPRGRPRKVPITDAATQPRASAAKTSRLPSPLPPVRAAPPHQPAKAPAPNRRKAAAQASIIEIADSESDDALASISSRSASPEPDNPFSSPPPVDLSISEDTELSLTASPTGQQSNIFGFITKAVTTAPRSTDPQKPSWHEKILMYDPIVLEDLAAWLNSGQLDRVGYDSEVAPGEVKQWCESKSVCCLWRFNLNGKERKRF